MAVPLIGFIGEAVRNRGLEQLVQCRLAQLRNQPRQCRRRHRIRRRQHVISRPAKQRFLHSTIQQLEMAGNVGFQREAVQHLFTKAVNGLDLQPARRVERRSEQGPCLVDQFTLDLAGHDIADLGDLFPQRRIIEQRPLGEPLENPVFHLRCRCLCVGQAQDGTGLGARQQQPDHPGRQHMGLAGSCIGRNPG